MQLAVGLLGGLGGGAGAGAAATGAAAAGAGAAAAGGGISAMSILSGAASIAGILGTIGAGNAQARSYKDQAFHAELEGENETAQAVQRQTGFKRELMRVLGENAVGYAAAGIDLGAGVSQDAAGAAKQRASEELSIDRATADARRAMLKARAAGFRRMAKEAKSAAMITAFGQGIEAIGSFAGRGA
jgi:hypothetical protein